MCWIYFSFGKYDIDLNRSTAMSLQSAIMLKHHKNIKKNVQKNQTKYLMHVFKK